MKPLKFLGGGTAGKSLEVTAQRKKNVYLEFRPDDEKGVNVVAFGTPGLKVAFSISPSLTAPIRGWLGTAQNLYAVAGPNFYVLSPGGVQIGSGSLMGTGTINLVSMAFSPTQLVVVDGVSGYLYQNSKFTVIGGSFPNGARTVTIVGTFFVAEQPGSQIFWVSNAGDGSTWTGLSFAGATAYGDNILAVDNCLGNLVIFSVAHMEFWQNVGSTPQPFAPIQSAVNEWGLGALFSRVHCNQNIYFLGATRNGQLQFCELSGYNVAVISTPDIDAIINSFPVTSDCVALTYQLDAHGMVQWTFPNADRSFLFDCSTRIWSEVQTGHTIKYATRHQGNLSTVFAGQTLISDPLTSTVYTLDPNTYTDNGAVIEREIVTKHAIAGYNEFTVDEIYLDMEQGVGLNSGQGSAPQIMLQVSRDSGHTWETEQWCPLGAMGQYGEDGNRVAWQRQGAFRQATFRVRMTDPVKFVLVNGALTVRAMKG